MKTLIIIMSIVAVVINIVGFVGEKIMKKRMEKLAKNKEN